jgi:hypothetical protein
MAKKLKSIIIIIMISKLLKSMHKFKGSYFLVILFVVCFSSFIPENSMGQIRSTTIQGYGSTSISVSFNTFVDYDASDSGILGTPYLHSDWMFGELILDDTIIFKSLFRYNLVRQEIELIVDKDTLAFQQPLRMNSFTIGDKAFVYNLILKEDFAGPYLEGSFFEVVVDGKAQLLKKYDKVIGGGFDGTRYAAATSSIKSYQVKQTYYVRKANQDYPQPIRISKRTVMKLFSDREQDVKAFRSENSINVKEEKELIKLFNYYNSFK